MKKDIRIKEFLLNYISQQFVKNITRQVINQKNLMKFVFKRNFLILRKCFNYFPFNLHALVGKFLLNHQFSRKLFNNLLNYIQNIKTFCLFLISVTL